MNVSKRQIGLGIATTLVLGNMVGSGIFLLPASLVPYGCHSLIGWTISAIGALLLVAVFFRLAKRASRAGGLTPGAARLSAIASVFWWRVGRWVRLAQTVQQA